MKKILLIVLGAAVIAFGLYLAVPQTGVVEGVDEARKDAAETLRYVAAEGKVEALPGLDVEVGSELIARIERITAREGERVEKGSVIVILDNSDIAAKLKETEGDLGVARARLKEVKSGSRKEEIAKAEASLEAASADLDLAESELERYRTLYSEKAVSKAQLDSKEREARVARARLREAQEELILLKKGPKEETVKLHEETVVKAASSVEYYRRLLEKTSIKAPISGTVLHRHLEEGETVIPETPILSIADTERVWVNAEVDETDVGRINVGDPAEVSSDAYPGKVFRGEIKEISGYVGIRTVKPNNPAKNLDMKVVQVKIGLKDKAPFIIGMTVDVRIIPGGARP